MIDWLNPPIIWFVIGFKKARVSGQLVNSDCSRFPFPKGEDIADPCEVIGVGINHRSRSSGAI